MTKRKRPVKKKRGIPRRYRVIIRAGLPGRVWRKLHAKVQPSTHRTSLADVAKAMDPDGKIATILKLMYETNEILKDSAFTRTTKKRRKNKKKLRKGRRKHGRSSGKS